MNEEEIWKPIPGYPLYEASSLGRIRSYAISRHRSKDDPPFLLSPSPTTIGYMTVWVKGDASKGLMGVHVLVALAFHGPRPSPNMVPDHKDRIKTNNAASNLRWSTRRLNAMNSGEYSHGSSGVRGVTYDKSVRLWRAHMKINGKGVKLGSSRSKEKAIAIRQSAEQQFWKDAV